MAFLARAEDAIDQTGTSDEALSAFLTDAELRYQNTGPIFLVMPYRPHHLVSMLPVQKLHRQLARAAG